MALIYPNTGERLALELMVGKSSQANWIYHLYTNDKTPQETDTTASYTEATESGYAAITLTGASWDTTSVAGTASYAEQTFTFGEGATVYGYYVTCDSKLMLAERFGGAPFTIPVTGGTIAVTPKTTAD